MKRPWQGRFIKDTAETVLKFTASLPFDRRLARQEIKGSLAHAEMLAERGIISKQDASVIIKGLEMIASEFAQGCFSFDAGFEDIHMNIEKRLIELVGPVGGKIHTARSRNDQVALDLHLYLMEEIKIIDTYAGLLQEALIKLARRCRGTVMPGYTHLQRAQPVLLSHHLLAYFWMLQRDRERLRGAYRRADLMPLGAAALAGTGFPVDREAVARKLGFSRLYENSMDAVSDRDYVAEFLFCASLLMMHLSRLSEEIILWCSAEFGYLELDDAFTTGSSIMPQKKNPDVAELTRGKTGRVYGNLFSLLTVLKGLPLAYNRDLQEDKEGLFDTVDTLKSVLPLLAEMLLASRFNSERMAACAGDDFTCATDLADYLAGQGVPFREAHHAVGSLVAFCLRENKLPRELSAEQRAAFHPGLAGDISGLLDPRQAVEVRRSRGGTASSAVEKQLKLAEASMRDLEDLPGGGPADYF